MTDFHQFLWLTGGFVVGNVLDGYTTWLDLFRLPQNCVGKELNPLAAKSITKHFSRQVVWKGLGVAFVVFLLLTEPSNKALSLVRMLDVLMSFVVINNTYVYFSRRKCLATPKRSPGEIIQHYLHVPNWLAFVILIGLYTGLSFLIVWSLGGWKY